ncbi:MAG: hypothetical protein JWR07_1951 [Nevskia sp.]|nr:hypothetical protein [Nevskia sp.]
MEANVHTPERLAEQAQRLSAYRIKIGARNAPRMSFEAMSTDACTAVSQHADLAEPGERVEALRIAADVAANVDKGERWYATNNRKAMQAQLRQMDVERVAGGRV